MVRLTVGLPLYNMGQIAELALTGLCNQKDLSFEWELLVIEEQTSNSLSRKKLMSYKNRLRSVGCTKIKYIPLKEWIPLGRKWHLLAQKSSETSTCFLLQAGDCYPNSLRLRNTYNSFSKGCDYYDEGTGLWYSYRMDKTILWKPNDTYTHPCMLNMAWSTKLIKQLPDNNKKKNIDRFLYKTLSSNRYLTKYRNESPPLDGVDTDGYNCISVRDGLFSTLPNKIFIETDMDALEEVPELIKYKGRTLNKRIKDK